MFNAFRLVKLCALPVRGFSNRNRQTEASAELPGSAQQRSRKTAVCDDWFSKLHHLYAILSPVCDGQLACNGQPACNGHNQAV